VARLPQVRCSVCEQRFLPRELVAGLVPLHIGVANFPSFCRGSNEKPEPVPVEGPRSTGVLLATEPVEHPTPLQREQAALWLEELARLLRVDPSAGQLPVQSFDVNNDVEYEEPQDLNIPGRDVDRRMVQQELSFRIVWGRL